MTHNEYILKNCARKLVFYTITQARKAAKQTTVKLGHKLYFYKCRFCHNYHLSKLDHPRKPFVIKSMNITIWR